MTGIGAPPEWPSGHQSARLPRKACPIWEGSGVSDIRGRCEYGVIEARTWSRRIVRDRVTAEEKAARGVGQRFNRRTLIDKEFPAPKFQTYERWREQDDKSLHIKQLHKSTRWRIRKARKWTLHSGQQSNTAALEHQLQLRRKTNLVKPLTWSKTTTPYTMAMTRVSMR